MASAGGKQILLVDDSKFQRTANMRVLTKAGYQVVLAGDGEEALAQATRTPPDLILLDLMLPKLSGVEVLKCLKSNFATSAVPVVVLSGLSDKNTAKLLEEGAVAYIEKSKLEGTAGSETLLQLVRAILH